MTTTPRRTAVVVGTSFGARIHARALATAGLDVVALVGRDRSRTERRAAAAGIPRACVDLDEALALRPDIVVVATPPATHYDLSLRALDAGSNVLCEKPFTMTIAEADLLADRADELGLVGYVGHEFRFAECASLVADVLQAGRIGTPRLATLVVLGSTVADTATPVSDWWFDSTEGGGWLGASGSHAIDRVRHWFGEIERVGATLGVTSDRRDSADDTFTITFRTVSGVDGVLQSTAGAWGPTVSVSRVAGTEGTVWIEDELGIGAVESVVGAVHLATREGTRVVPVPPEIALTAPASLDPKYHRNVLPYARLYRLMLDAVEGRSLDGATIPATFADGAASMRVLAAIRESAERGGEVVYLDTSTRIA